jgi:hypothetical protein
MMLPRRRDFHVHGGLSVPRPNRTKETCTTTRSTTKQVTEFTEEVER